MYQSIPKPPRSSHAVSKNCKILLFPTADRRFDMKVKCPTGRASFWVKFPPVRSLMRVKFPGIARGWGYGWFWNWLVHKCELREPMVHNEPTIKQKWQLYTLNFIRLQLRKWKLFSFYPPIPAPLAFTVKKSTTREVKSNATWGVLSPPSTKLASWMSETQCLSP